MLEHIKSIHVGEDNSDKPTEVFTIKIDFTENDFFTNEQLSFTVKQLEDDCQEVIGCSIDWKAGKDVTKKKIQKKQKNKKSKETRTITKTIQCDSVFNCFESKKLPEGHDASKKEEEDDEDSETEKLLDQMEEARLFAVNLHDLY